MPAKIATATAGKIHTQHTALLEATIDNLDK